MTTYTGTCECGITISAETEAQLDAAVDRHLKGSLHNRFGDWPR